MAATNGHGRAGRLAAIALALVALAGLCALLFAFADVLLGIFGLWRLIGVEVVALMVTLAIRVRLGGVRVTTRGEVVTFDPREAPMLLAIGVQVAAIGYLAVVYGEAPRTLLDAWVFFGAVVGVNGATILAGVVWTLRNRRDVVTLGEGRLRWQDNASHGDVALSDLVAVTYDADLHLRLADGREIVVPLASMNFDPGMAAEVLAALRARAPQLGPGEAP